MAEVTSMTADEIASREADAVVGGKIDANGHLLLTTRSGFVIDAGGVPMPDLSENWPIGSIYLGVNATNPHDLLGFGTWQAWGTGKMPVGVDPNDTDFNAAEKTGGEKAHTIQTTELPQHAHSIANHTHTINHDHSNASTGAANWGSFNNTMRYRTINYVNSGSTTSGDTISSIGGTPGSQGTQATGVWSHTHSVDIPSYTGTSGSGGSVITGITPAQAPVAANNMSPFITCYMWKRTA